MRMRDGRGELVELSGSNERRDWLMKHYFLRPGLHFYFICSLGTMLNFCPFHSSFQIVCSYLSQSPAIGSSSQYSSLFAELTLRDVEYKERTVSFWHNVVWRAGAVRSDTQRLLH